MSASANTVDAAATALARLQSPISIAAEPLPFWASRLLWLQNPIQHLPYESNVKMVWEGIVSEYVWEHQRSFSFAREHEIRNTKFSRTDPTIADFAIFVNRPDPTNPGTAPEPIPLSVIENKVGLGSLNENKEAVGQVIRAMLERLWTGEPIYNPVFHRLTLEGTLEMARHSPMFGISGCRLQFRRVIILNANVGFIDTSNPSDPSQAVTYSGTEWSHYIYLRRDQRALDLHFKLMDLYSRYVVSLAPEEAHKAYGDEAGTPSGSRTLDDGFTNAVKDNPGAHNMSLFDPAEFANDQQGIPMATPGSRPGPPDGGGDGNGDGRAREGGDNNSKRQKRNETGTRKTPNTRSTGARGAGQTSTSAQTTRKTVSNDKGESQRGRPPTLTGSSETHDSTGPPTPTDDGTCVSIGGALEREDVVMADDSGSEQMRKPFIRLPHAQHSAATSVRAASEDSDNSEEQAAFNPRKPPFTKSEEARMDAMLRPMSQMTYEERRTVFGVVGEGWEAFAEAYIGCPVMNT